MRSGEIAARVGITAKAVRYYESLGLIAPARPANGYRDYSACNLRLFREIRQLRRLGIPVNRTRPFLECLSAGEDHVDDCPASLPAYRDAITELTGQITALAAKRARLTARLQQAARHTRQPMTDKEESMSVSEPDLTRLPENLPRPVNDGAADHLPGQALPPLTLASTSGERISLDALGPGRSILYVYPLTGRPDVDLPDGWDTIPGARGCTSEACDFRDHHTQLREAGAGRVFGLSSQETNYQRELVGRLRLPFAILADPQLALATSVGLPTFTTGGMTLYKRLTLVVRDGVIEHVFHPIFPPNTHAQQVLTWLHTTAN